MNLPLALTIALALFSYEKNTGMNKQCVYNHLGSEYVLIMPLLTICPLTIEVD
ncbi:hypothetical protein [uncultured Paraglaciecola sp.]|uniref:hypothetical protein n=1 Tax=uncultured Paraglaciecola sp. TaxID=1765024 RepID=UPI0026085A4B|nr:hypothetical protein [uncultured Paraglaciecola sp.]